MTIDEMIKVLEAARDGAIIEFRSRVNNPSAWCTVTDRPTWNFHYSDYRVKPQPREFYANIYQNDNSHAMHSTKAQADASALDTRVECIKVREVVE